MRPPVSQYGFRDRDLRGHGCVLASLAWLAREATGGKAWSDAEAYSAKLQKLSGVPLATFRERGTTMTEAQTAYRKAPGFKGRVPPRMRLFRGGNVRDDMLPLLRDGKWSVVAVNYGAIQDAGRGVGSFRGGHAVVVGEPGNGKVTVADPLRRGLVRWPIDLLVTAMETFGKRPWGNGRGEFGIVAPAPTLLSLRTRQRDEARRSLADVTERLDAQKAQTALAIEERDQARRELAACQAQTPPDCATEAARAFAAEAKVTDALAVLTR